MSLMLAPGHACSPSGSLQLLRPQIPWSIVNLRISPQFFRSGRRWSQPSWSVARFLCAPVIALNNNSSPLPTGNVPSLSPELTGDNGFENLSAKERRKMRNKRREENILSVEKPWKEMVEDRLLEKKKKITGWKEDSDINRCISKGMQWWMIQTARNFEQVVADQISVIFPKTFPGREFEVSVPSLPVKALLKDGHVSKTRKKVFQGIVLLRCVLDHEVWSMVKQTPRVYEFFGHFAGMSTDPIIMPAPVSSFNLENMFEEIRQADEEFEQFKEEWDQKRSKGAQRLDIKEQQTKEQGNLMANGLVLEVGATVRVLSGPFLDFTGVVTEVPQNANKIKVLMTLFGNDVPVALDVKEVTVEAAAP